MGIYSHRWLTAGLASSVFVMAAVHAETPYERDQREQQEQYQRQHGLSQNQLQIQRWTEEWKREHPGQPVPNLGVLEKLHLNEIMANSNASMQKMWQDRQAQLERQHLAAHQRQAQALAAQHITWTNAQWNQWEARYQQDQQAQAQAYINGSNASGEMAREEAAAHPQY